MAVSDDYRDFVLEQLAPLGHITARRMFGGVGIYANGLFFALIDDDVLYLKGDESLKVEFEAAGSHAFTPFGYDKPMGYWTAPAEAMDDQEFLLDWSRKSLEVAARAAATKKKR
ncbi:TfoX/Sxy family protein [Caulobacter sp. RL271]|jgi:DNA transformation protein|uniref:TfoX/Sxy family protein n=1 Tax=Caulobacter segnis TaxID=88688 RepID=A0ABY4ZV81_9CAUL|nr:TfoX/Sxy family protein [Caulobacter segnis]USQ96478.1 TfoX/Sxy family protein [Caulobacter segnis]